MNKLLSTTALVVALGFPGLTFAQTAEPAEETAETETIEQDAGQMDANMSGFLAERSQSDIFASELIGRDVHARRAAGDTEATGDQATGNTDDQTAENTDNQATGNTDDQTAENTDDQATGTTDGTHDMAMMNRADLDGMDNIGQVNEIVLSKDGQVRALVIGVGGFLGMGEHDVAVSMDQVTFASDAEDTSQMYVVLNTESEMLKEAPAYDRTSDMNDAAMNDTAAGGEDTDRAAAGTDAGEAGDGTGVEDRTAFAAPEMEREGYERVEVRDVSTDMLTGKTVYDTNDDDVGTVTDMLLDGDGKITNVIIDFGGFLGIGSSQASLQYKELTILSNEGYEDVRIYVDATKEQIQELPRYMASN